MRIGVDVACWANARGYGRFTRELLRALVAEAPDDEFVCFVEEAGADAFDLRAPNVRVVAVPQGRAPTEAAAADGYRAPLDMFRFTRAVWREPTDVFFSPSVYTYFPLPPGRRSVITVHDAIADRFPELTLPSRRAQLFWRLKVGMALRQASLVLTVSPFAAREIAEVLGVSRDRIRIALEAPSPIYRPSRADEVDAARRALGIPDGAPWFAYVGGFNPHKHVDVIARAHATIVREEESRGGAPPHLVLVGRRSGDVFHGVGNAIDDAVRAGGAEALVHWPGFMPDDALRHVLSGARALLLPSENEGFGLPAVEAAACGTPVIATTASPLPELLAGGGFFVPPRDGAALETAMRALLDDGARAILGARARERAALLSWTRGARSALGALREAVTGARAPQEVAA